MAFHPVYMCGNSGGPGAWAHLGIEHVDAEVAEGSLEEVIFGAVLEERAVHGVGPHLRA